ncbi:hypothetical protein [Ferroplasma sp.]
MALNAENETISVANPASLKKHITTTEAVIISVMGGIGHGYSLVI